MGVGGQKERSGLLGDYMFSAGVQYYVCTEPKKSVSQQSLYDGKEQFYVNWSEICDNTGEAVRQERAISRQANRPYVKVAATSYSPNYKISHLNSLCHVFWTSFNHL